MRSVRLTLLAGTAVALVTLLATGTPLRANTDTPATTGTQTPAATPPAAVSADAAVTEKLRDLSSGKYDRILGRKTRPGVEAFYSGRQFAPLWLTDGKANDRAKAAIAFLSGVEADALDPLDYPTPDFAMAKDAEALAEAEMKLTESVLAFARHAQIGRVHYTRTASDVSYDLKASEPNEVLAKLADGDMRAALDSFNPQHAGYKKLKAKLAELRSGKKEPEPEVKGPAPIEHGETLKLLKKGEMNDVRVPALRARLGIADSIDTAYDKEVAAAVTRFQKEKKIKADGQLNKATVDALNGKVAAAPKKGGEIDAIVATMERWRWMPRELGNPYVVVNVPDYSLRIVKDDKLYWKTKIVAGKPSQATPIISAEMKFITVNPTWNVPPSIIQNEYLPALREDPQALERIGLKITQNADGTVRIYQPPGDRNALGRIRFNFPNKYLVYQHDTPDKHLFAHDKRAYSHGCMRVQDPLMYGEKLLSLTLPKENYTADRLQKMFGGSEININFPQNIHIPVHLTYQTAFVDDDGKLVVREDVYNRDARLLAVMRGSEKKVADIAIARAPDTSAKPVRLPVGSVGGSYGYRYEGGGFFDMLFGGGSPEPAPQTRRGGPRDRISQR